MTSSETEMLSYALLTSTHLDGFPYSSDSLTDTNNNEVMMSQDPLFTNDRDNNTMIGWTEKHPRNWSNDDLLDWIYTVAGIGHISIEGLRAENFQGLDGRQLCGMLESDFVQRDQINGAILYSCFAELIRESQFVGLDSQFEGLDDQDCIAGDLLDLDAPFDISSSGLELPSISEIFNKPDLDLNFDDLYLPPVIHSTRPLLTPKHQPSGYNCRIKMATPDPGYESAGSSDSNDSKSNVIGQIKLIVKCEPVEEEMNPQPVRKPGRPRKRQNSDSSTDEGCPSPPKQGLQKKSKATHLWKFMRTLLDDPEYNPECIRWENKDIGVFRIVPGQSKVIARLWGLRKNNPTMTFDKLSRSLRWCRTFGFLSDVPKDEGFPKKLCFRFGNRAYEWNK